MELAQAAALADEYANGGLETELANLRGEWGDEIEAAARNPDYRSRAGVPRDRPVPLPPEARAPAPRARGREPGRARVGADRAGGPLARRIPATSTRTGRCCTRSRRAIRTSPCAALRSSASRTALRPRDDRDPRRHRGRRRGGRRRAKDRRLRLAAARQEVEQEVGAWRSRRSSALIMGRAPTGRRCSTPPRR